MTKKILVTGGMGWLGGAVVRDLLSRGHQVVAADLVANEAYDTMALTNRSLKTSVVDLANSEQIKELVKIERPDVVVHCAALVAVAPCADRPALAYRVNAEGTANLFEAMRAAGVGRMVNVSTEETYGDFQAPVIDESHPQNPTSIYGTTKLASEQIGRVYALHYGMQCVNIRTCWVYGPNLPRPRMPKTYIDAALKGEALRLSGDIAVDQVFLDDTVQGVVLAVEKDNHQYDAYNIATGEAPKLSDVARIVNEAIPGADIQIEPGPYYPAPGLLGAKKGALDISRARAELGYEPKFSIKRGIETMIELSRAEMKS